MGLMKFTWGRVCHPQCDSASIFSCAPINGCPYSVRRILQLMLSVLQRAVSLAIQIEQNNIHAMKGLPIESTSNARQSKRKKLLHAHIARAIIFHLTVLCNFCALCVPLFSDHNKPRVAGYNCVEQKICMEKVAKHSPRNRSCWLHVEKTNRLLKRQCLPCTMQQISRWNRPTRWSRICLAKTWAL